MKRLEPGFAPIRAASFSSGFCRFKCVSCRIVGLPAKSMFEPLPYLSNQVSHNTSFIDARYGSAALVIVEMFEIIIQLIFDIMQYEAVMKPWLSSPSIVGSR